MTRKIVKQLILNNNTAFLVAVILLSLLCIAPAGTGLYHYSVDHVMHLRIAQGKDISEVIKLSLYEVHPPLGYIIWHYWLKLFSDPFYVRYLSLLFTLASVILSYKIGALLKNRTGGVCVALLFATAHGIVVQSFVVRNYAILTFFLVAQLYAYLRLQRQETRKMLAIYAVFSLFALLTHFVAIFNTAVFTVVYTIRRLKKEAVYEDKAIPFFLLNIGLGVVGIALYSVWLPTIHYNVQAALWSGLSFFDDLGMRLFKGGFYLFPTLMFLSPGVYSGMAFFLLLPVICRIKNLAIRQLLSYSTVALIIAFLLYITRISPTIGTRHELWLVPFLIPVIGLSVACWVEAISNWLAKKGYTHAQALVLVGVIMLFITLAATDPERFNDQGEHEYSEEVWKKLDNYFESLPPSALIIMGRQDTILFRPEGDNIYRLFSESVPGKQKNDIGIIKPFKHTRMLFSDYHMWVRKKLHLILLANQLQHNPELSNVQKLIFVKTLTDINDEPALYCDKLEHYKTTLPAEGSGDPSNRTLTIIEMSKKAFLDDLVAENGKAHGCFPGQ